jgi:preprotein translocase subunit SecD
VIEKGIVSLATIQSALGASFRITRLDSIPEASELSLLLRAGSLAAPMYFVQERTIGPSLGQKNIDAGMMSVLLGFVLVLVYMIFYYRGFGLIANAALTLNLMMLIACMSILSATLTLPGIAGIVLTVGMAVDANVLIFERIKEELGNPNTSMRDVVEEGFSRAWPSIRDANISSIITAVILFYIGTTLTQGFAVTFGLGVLVSMLTAISISRTFLIAVAGETRTKIKHALFAPGLRTGNEFNEHTD